MRLHLLTDREFQVANLVHEGLSYQEIADRLEIARSTVISHVERCCHKLGIKGRLYLAIAVEQECQMVRGFQPGGVE